MQNYDSVAKLEDDATQFQVFTPMLRMHELNQALTVLDKGQNVWITGDFGSGKTSLLLLIENRLLADKQVRVHKINLSLLKNDADFFESLYGYLKIKKKQRSVEDIIRSLEKQQLVLLIDEFSVIRNNPSFSESFTATLRHIIQNSKLQLVVTSQKLINQSEINVSPFLNLFVQIILPPLTNEAATFMLHEIMASSDVKLDDKDLKKAVELAQGLPRNIYRIGSLLMEHSLDLNKAFEEFSISQNSLPDNLRTISETPPSEIHRQYSISDDVLEKHIATDKPVQNIKQDKLDFKIYVNALHKFILSNYTTTPITISIDGVWGSGKSSLMSMLKEKLDPHRDGVRVFFEWLNLIWPAMNWYWKFLCCFLPKAFGKALIALTVRNDLDDNNIQLYFGDRANGFKKYITKIVEGFNVDPEFLKQDESKSMDELVRWWAQINANCEPLEPSYHYTVWLNAWKFDNQEEVWASLALATMEQIKQNHGLLWRLRFWCELNFSRFSFWSGLWQVIKQFFVPMLFAIVAAYYSLIMGSFNIHLEAMKLYGSPLLWAGALISGILSVSSIFNDPFRIPLAKVFDRANYQDKVNFLSQFEKDFARIVRAATKNGFGWKRSKLVIFIDDLDRCEPPKSADIVEAVNLFLDAEGCVFVIGMDSESVARSIEVKYKDLFERMETENIGVVSLGRLFLEKIVQIPFSVPRATSLHITNLVNETLGTKKSLQSSNLSLSGKSSSFNNSTSGVSKNDPDFERNWGILDKERSEYTSQTAHLRIDPASYAKHEVRTAILKGTELLAGNPRQVKTFINLFRLSIYIANERKILEERILSEQTSGLNLDKLAIWTACLVRWQNLIRHLHTETQITPLRNFLYSMSHTIQPGFAWAEPNKIPDGIKTNYKKLREDEKGSESHWCYLPWEWWLLEPDFVKMIKSLQDLWGPPPDGEIDWLKVLLTMTKPIA
jgi:hypothetical protein